MLNLLSLYVSNLNLALPAAAFAALPAPTSAEAIGWIALTLAAACVALNAVVGFYKNHLRERPTPSETYATKAEHNELKLRVDSLGEKIEANFRALDQKRSVSIAGLHDDLNNKSDALRHEMKRDNEGLHSRLSVVLEKVAELRGKASK